MYTNWRTTVSIVGLVTTCVLAPLALAADDNPGSAVTGLKLDCATAEPNQWLAAFRAAVDRGEIHDPRIQPWPQLPPPQPQPAGPPACLTPEQIFLFEDTNSILVTNFTDQQLFLLLLQAINTLLASEGDNYDFIGFWLNFQPHHTIGTAFYAGIQNDVMGIGLDLFDFHAKAGIPGERLQGVIMMWDVNASFWQPGDGPEADFTRLVLGQEFEHRFAMFLPALGDGRVLQGNDANCGRSAHWNWQVDGQGSSMEISEWLGSDPAVREQSSIAFNTDTGGVFSYTDLYLMGYVSPQEMDLGNSELRFMDDSNCSPNYFGPISKFASSDIIASAGVRIPSSRDSQKDFRAAWIMVHLPGAPPTDPQLDKSLGILEQHMIDWKFSTLDRGTMDNSLFADCNCNGVPDSDDIAGGDSDDNNGNGIPDECECPADLDRSGDVGVKDLLFLLGTWGPCPKKGDCSADFDFDGDIGVKDLLFLLGAWGPCR